MYDLQNLTNLKKMDALTPEVMKAFWAFDKLSVADGRKAGKTGPENVEAAMVAASLRAGAEATHATHCLTA